jgi:SAM-dependent methyltransferase
MGSYLGRHADYYDVFYAGKDYAAESAFVDRVLAGAGRPVRRVLELACGTGAHAFHLERFGYEMVSTDYSEDMLRIARQKGTAAGSKVRFERQDMRTLEPHLAGFDAAIALFDSIGYVRDDASVAAVLAGVRRALAPGGIFLFEFWHAPAMLRGYDPVRVRRWPRGDGELVRISETTLDGQARLASVRYDILDLRGDGTFERVQETQVNRFFTVTEMRAFLEAAELEPLRFHAGFHSSERIDDSVWHVVAVARRT